MSTTAQVANANVNKVWKNARDDETLAMIAEGTMRDLYTTAGASSGQAAANYDPSVKNEYTEFGIGLVFTTALTIAQLEALQLKVSIYQDWFKKVRLEEKAGDIWLTADSAFRRDYILMRFNSILSGLDIRVMHNLFNSIGDEDERKNN